MATTSANYDNYVNEPSNQDFSSIPGDMGMPLVGHTFSFYKDPFEWARENYPKYGPIIKANLLGGGGVVVLGPELMERIYLDPGRDFSSKMGFMDRVATFFGGSVIMEDFEHHRHQRRILQTAFKNDSLKHYTSEINSIYDRALKDWEADDGKTIEFFMSIKELLLEVAAEIFLGEEGRGKRMKKINQSFIDCVNGTMYIVPFPFPGNKLYKGLKGREFLEKTFRALVPVKRAGDGLDMLSHFCREKDEDGNLFSDEEIANQAIFLLFAAHDTTTAAVTHTIYYLARHPEVKERLYQECKSLNKDTLDYEDLDNVPYMQQIFWEIQRMRTSTPIVPRRTIREVELAGVKIPAHTMIFTVPRYTCHMEEYWKEPFKFDPDRFSPERAEQKQHSFLFHPFGGGAHKCIGMHFSQMEYKCFLHKFILKYDFEARHKDDPFMQSLPLPKPADNMPILLKRR
jgi:cytochrome P450